MVESVVPTVPAVIEILQECQARVSNVRMEGQNFLAAARLVKNALAGGKSDWMRVAVSTDAAHHAEIVIERSIFLHQHNDVFDVADGASAVTALDRNCTGDGRCEQGCCGGANSELEKSAAADRRHGTVLPTADHLRWRHPRIR
jgi:hypothetical protein